MISPLPAPSVILKNLKVKTFRNLKPLEWEPGRYLNIIHGKNGAGKSSLIEAIHYLSMLRSFRGAKVEELIQLDATHAIVEGAFDKEPLATSLFVRLQNENPSKELRLNQKKVRSRPQWFSEVPMVLFHSGHVELSSGAPQLRRGYMDQILEQVDPTYCTSLTTYSKALRQRNFLLKQCKKNDHLQKKSAFRAYDEILVNAGIVIIHTRQKLIQDMAPEIEKAFSFILEEKAFEVHYTPNIEPDSSLYFQKLQENFSKDQIRGFTGTGPHGDDVEILFKGHATKQFASQGQKRSMALALKLGEVFFLAQSSEKIPILLLDDVSSELDRERTAKLFQIIEELRCQVFLTTTEPSLIRFEGDCKRVQVNDGILQIESN